MDGANNKWVGTIGSGVFYFSPNGQQTIYHFTKENSPLPSNNINDISVNLLSGKVFFATDKGLVSYNTGSSSALDNFSNSYVSPNPVRPSFNMAFDKIKIDGLTDSVNIKITDIEGNLVAEAQSNVNKRYNGFNLEIDGGTAFWNGKNLRNVNYITQMSGAYTNKWKKLYLAWKNKKKIKSWSGQQPINKSHISDFQDFIPKINYNAYEKNLIRNLEKIKKAKTFLDFFKIYFESLAKLVPPKKNLIYKHQNFEAEKSKKINMVEKLAERENRDCEKCGKLTEVYFSRKGGRRPFLICISCNNMQDMKKRGSRNIGYEKTDGKGKSKMTAAIKEETRFCPKCKSKKVKLVLKNSRYGPFYSCSNWKRDKSGCNHTEKV